jgi:hypothetical protein
MKDAIEMNLKGIRCDNPECDYKDMSVEADDFKDWLNKPCPECGANLLTQADYDNVVGLIELAKLMNQFCPKVSDDEKIVKVKVEMNGTGEMDFKLQK